jgi:hypothetical protein
MEQAAAIETGRENLEARNRCGPVKLLLPRGKNKASTEDRGMDPGARTKT